MKATVYNTARSFFSAIFLYIDCVMTTAVCRNQVRSRRGSEISEVDKRRKKNLSNLLSCLPISSLFHLPSYVSLSWCHTASMSGHFFYSHERAQAAAPPSGYIVKGPKRRGTRTCVCMPIPPSLGTERHGIARDKSGRNQALWQPTETRLHGSVSLLGRSGELRVMRTTKCRVPRDND